MRIPDRPMNQDEALAAEYLDAAAGDMPEPWWRIAVQLLAEYRSEALAESEAKREAAERERGTAKNEAAYARIGRASAEQIANDVIRWCGEVLRMKNAELAEARAALAKHDEMFAALVPWGELRPDGCVPVGYEIVICIRDGDDTAPHYFGEGATPLDAYRDACTKRRPRQP